jgi:hypothetical protein
MVSVVIIRLVQVLLASARVIMLYENLLISDVSLLNADNLAPLVIR